MRVKGVYLLTILSAIFMVACGKGTTTNNYTTNITNPPANASSSIFTLNPTSPAGLIPPGQKRELMVLTVTAPNACQITDMIFSLVSEGQENWGANMVNCLSVEDGSGNVLLQEPCTQPWQADTVFKLTGNVSLAKGAKDFYVYGKIMDGRLPNETPNWSFKTELIASKNTCENKSGILVAGNLLVPQYTSDQTAYISLAPDSPAGAMIAGAQKTLIKFNASTDAGAFYIDWIAFTGVYNPNVWLTNCQIRDGNDIVFMSYFDHFTESGPGGGTDFYIGRSEEQLLPLVEVNTANKKFSFTCDVVANGEQAVQLSLGILERQAGSEGYYYHLHDPLPIMGNNLIITP